MQNLADYYQRLKPHLIGNGNLEIRSIRDKALQTAINLDLPSNKASSWKYANFTDLTKIDFQPFLHPELSVTKKIADIIQKYCLRYNKLVFVNGHCSNVRYKNDKDLTLQPLSQLAQQQPELLEEILDSYQESEYFCAANTALLTDGSLIIIPENAKVEKPIILLNIITENNHPHLINLKTKIILNPRSQATIIACTVNLSSTEIFQNNTVNIVLERESKLNYINFSINNDKMFDFTSTTTNCHNGSSFNYHPVIFGKQYGRYDNTTHIQDINSQCNIYGLLLAKNQQQLDWASHIYHTAGHSHSKELVRAVVTDKAHSSYFGNITINHNAANANASMENKNLLLSDQAKADSAPHLEIYNDEVRCNHSAAVNNIDQEAMFFLRSRGLTKTQASYCIVNGFIEDIIAKFPDIDFKNIVLQHAMQML